MISVFWFYLGHLFIIVGLEFIRLPDIYESMNLLFEQLFDLVFPHSGSWFCFRRFVENSICVADEDCVEANISFHKLLVLSCVAFGCVFAVLNVGFLVHYL